MASLVLIPDTQFLSETAAWTPHFQAAADWIVANQATYDIQLVLHLGDVVDDGIVAQYDRAATPMQTIWDSGIPFAAAIGNHDYDNSTGDVADHDATTRWNTYFGTGKYTGQSWWDGGFRTAGESENMWFRVSLGGRATLVLLIEFYPRAAVLTWAESVIAANPNHDVIVVTHSYLNDDGSLTKDDDEHGPDAYTIADTSSGVEMWAAFKQYSNVVAVFNGHHINGPNTAEFSDVGDGGNSVFQQFTNWQQDDEGGDGRIVLLEIDGAVATRQVYNARTASFETEYELQIQFYATNTSCEFGDGFTNAFAICTVAPALRVVRSPRYGVTRVSSK